MPRKRIEEFSIEHLQILDENGKVDRALEPKIPDADLRRLYRTMLAARMVDLRMYKLQQQGRMGTFPGVRGQEGGNLGCVYALRPQDWLVPSFRETSGMFWRGMPFKNVLTYYMGLDEANVYPDGMNTLPLAINVGSQTLHGTGIAWAAKLRGDDVVALIFFGDGATSTGDFHEACNMAGVFQTPAIFVCVNNQYAISTCRSTQSRSQTLAQKAIAYGFPALQVDGNDLLAAYVAAKEAHDRARAGQGPTMIECVTYRVGPHTTADDPRRYRSDEEVKEWERRDPISRFRKYLEGKKLWTQAWQDQIEAELKEEIEEQVREAEAELARAEPLDMFDYVYGEPTPELQAQKEELAEFTPQHTDAPTNGRG
jgi:pyruvate dehydrogenase E1 component alpha subunit